MGIKINFRIITKNHAADFKIRFPKKIVFRDFATHESHPTAWELNKRHIKQCETGFRPVDANRSSQTSEYFFGWRVCVTLAVHAKKKVLGVNEPPSHLKQIYRSESQNLSIAKILIRKFHSRFGYLIICPRSILRRSFLIKKVPIRKKLTNKSKLCCQSFRR